ncbi:MAG TPA: hypothetical protein VHQ94_14145 [Pyrinomonadaceae bacterium]|jgi:hypothetical protein|nr:hypothetical protein [Pyrinomonadaceae bacterium]
MKQIIAVTTFTLTLILACLNVAAQTQSRDDVIKELETKRAELSAVEKKVLAVADSDREEFAAFLSQPQTGIVRLLPREQYSGNTKRGLAISGGGAVYSFVGSTYESEKGYDIQFYNGDFSVGFAGADYGMLLNLGDTPLDQVVSEQAAVRALLNYKPATAEPDARTAHKTLWEGLDLSGAVFKNRLPAKVSNTYLLRSILYNDSDIAVAFRVTRKDTDGSVIILYKVLKKFPVPKLERMQTAAQ